MRGDHSHNQRKQYNSQNDANLDHLYGGQTGLEDDEAARDSDGDGEHEEELVFAGSEVDDGVDCVKDQTTIYRDVMEVESVKNQKPPRN